MLGDEQAVALLGDRSEVEQVMRSISEINDSYFGGAELRPNGGWARSPAFALTGDNSRRMRAAYAATMADLYYGAGEPPSFDAVCMRVAELGELL